MGIALAATGWWMYIDVPQTPKAVVACVIVFNAAFGYSWGPLPWLYPPEVGWILNLLTSSDINCLAFLDYASDIPSEGRFDVNCHELGI